MRARIAISPKPRHGLTVVPAHSAAHRESPARPHTNDVAVMAHNGPRFDQVPVRDPGSHVTAEYRQSDMGDETTSLIELIAMATTGPSEHVPYRAMFEEKLGHSLAHIESYSGPEVAALLQSIDAVAATAGNMVLFATDHPDIGTVAHEIVHVLQSGGRTSGEPSFIAPENDATEREANEISRELTSGSHSPMDPVIGVLEQLAPDQVALQRSANMPRAEDGGVAVLEHPTFTEPERIADRPPETTGESEAGQVTSVREAGSGALPGGEDSAAAGLELPPAPEPGITAEDVAAREAALAEAQAVLSGAQDVPELMSRFADAPPSIKAAHQGELTQNATNLAQQESQQFQERLPDIHASMSGDTSVVEPVAIQAPESRTVVIEESTLAPAPEPEIEETPDPGSYSANDNATRIIDQFFGSAEPADRAGQVGESLQAVSTTDPEIPQTPGPRPTVPLEGESDPVRLASQQGDAVAGARGVRDEAQQAVIFGPGPERSQPVHVDEPMRVDALNQPTVAPVAPVEGAQSYLSMGLPPEVQTAFDQQQQPVMQASMAGAVGQAQQAATERDQTRQAEVESAETQAAQLSLDADVQQQAHVGEARATIQNERQATLNAQSSAVQDMETSAESRSATDRESIDTRVAADEVSIGDRYQTAETDVATEIRQGEQEAETRKQQAAREAEEESWWDQAVSFVRDAFNALVDAINVVFDAVRSAVNGILDAAKVFALSVIDAAASFIKDAIAAYGEFLKAAIDGLLGDIFPGLAAALTSAIDNAVSYAQGLVDDVANGLKAGVAALVDGLKAGLNRILDIYQAGLNLAVGLVQAALTGDWSALARKLLEAVLLVIGVDPESFYAFIGRAEETFQIILDDPLGFLGNLIDAFTGGVRLFADNLLTHLQTGIIGWLTGALGSAGITLPERFDLFGVLSLVQQILGLTWDRLRQKAVQLVGEANVARLEYIVSYIQTLVTEGWGGLWERIQGDIATLKDQVLDAIKSFILERIVMASITKIASLFSPVGAIVQLVLTAWNLYTFMRDQLQRIFAVVQVVVNAIGDIARGVLAPGMARVEEVLASLLPLALDLLARLLGLGNVGTRVREIIESIQQTIDRAIDTLIERVLAAFRGGGASQQGTSTRAEDGQDAGVVEERFEVAGESHTIRAVVTNGQATLLMASDSFTDMIPQMTRLLENLRNLYTRPGGWVHGTPRAAQFEQDFTAIEDAGADLGLALSRESDPVREQRLAENGIQHLKNMFNRLGLPEATFAGPGIPAGHDSDSQMHSDGIRPHWYEVNPLSEMSLGRGAEPGGSIPGWNILPGYQRGHLVAKSLGGVGTTDNLSPMSSGTNQTSIGMRRIENDLFTALTTARGNPQAVPPYIFSYRVTAEYNSDGGLQAELGQRAGAAPGSEARLFGLASHGDSIPDDQLIHNLRNPTLGQLAPGDQATLAGNIRNRLAWHYLPKRFLVSALIIQQPERRDMQTTISSSQPVTNHLGRSSLEWRES